MKTMKEGFEIIKNLTDDADLIAFCNKEIEKIERREVQIQLDALSKLVNTVDIEIVKTLKNDLIQFALKNLTNL